MNGSRSTPPRHAEASSLDALSRTIEGLEARIEGLMSSTARDTRQQAETRRDWSMSESSAPAERSRPASPERSRRADPLAEIRERQRALEASRQQPAAPADRVRLRDRTPMPAPRPIERAAVESKALVSEITEALLGLRQDLKHDISQGVSRELDTLRAEIQGLKSIAGDRHFGEEMRADIARLAKSIDHLGQQKTPVGDNLRAEFDELRSLMDGLAREDSVRGIEQRWTGVEDRLEDLGQSQKDASWLRQEIVQLFDRLEEIKGQLTSMGDSRAIRALEDKLIAVATALEHIGSHMDPNERALQEQFAGLDLRLDEITRAIAASNNRAPTPSIDPRMIERLEDRIASIGAQIGHISAASALQSEPTDEIVGRLEALSNRIEEMASARTASNLEERLDQLSQLIEQQQQPFPQPDLTDHLLDISRKIDALDQGTVSNSLADRLDHLARMIGEIEQPAPAPAIDDRALRTLDERLAMIAERLDETSRAPAADTVSLRGLEEQIAHLSGLIGNVSQMSAPAVDGEVTERISRLEDYVATSDEYIIEAARQAAEAVMENFSRNGMQGGVSAPQLETITALADNLRHLEDLSRDNEHRTQKTFDSLQDTLLQIADRLDSLHHDADEPPARYVETAPNIVREAQPAQQFAYTGEDDLLDAPADLPPLFGNDADRSEPDLVAELDVTAYATEHKASKPSLLAGLGKKLIPGQKKQPSEPAARQVLDPTPTIDPVGIIPDDDANELLEPGTGAPDVRKILERVRASKMGNGADIAAPADGERTDYIAAARRAAQAAAQDAGNTQSTSGGSKAAKDGASAFSRYRRPILLAAGAVLLAVMSMPLVRTLTQGNENPPAIETTSPVTDDASAVGAAATPEVTADAPVSSDPAIENVAPLAPLTPLDEELSTEEASTPGAPMDTLETPAEPATGTDAAPIRNVTPDEAVTDEGTNAAQATPAAAAYEVPAAISPASLSKAAAEGDPLALFEIGARYTEGRGVDADLKEAARWYGLSADKGFAPAQYRVANLYEKGTGVQQDLNKAMEYYELAAAQGNAAAMHNLAVLFASGAAGTQDYGRASEWFIQAAEHGVPDSQFNLAILYARGNGVPQSFEDSYKWFAIAAKDGDKDAAQKQEEVARALTPEQLSKAKAAVEAWKPKPLDVDANAVNVPDEWVGKGTSTGSIDMKKAIQNVQAILNKNGFNAGTADGVIGAKTVSAIKAFQTSVGQKPTGEIDDALVKELLARNK